MSVQHMATPAHLFLFSNLFFVHHVHITTLKSKTQDRLRYVFCPPLRIYILRIWLGSFKLKLLPFMSVALSLLFLLKTTGLSPKPLVDNGCLLFSLRLSFSISAALCLSTMLKTTGSSLKSTIQASMTALSRATQISAKHLPYLSLFSNLQSLQHD